MDEFKKKKKAKRIEIEFISTISDPLPAIDISNFLTELSSLYYKTDLIYSIAIYLKNGGDPKDLLITQGSLSNSKVTNDDNVYSLSSDFDFFYKLGFVVSMSPNEMIYKMKLLTDGYRRINNVLFDSEMRIISRNRFKGLIKDIENGLNSNSFYKLKEYAEKPNRANKKFNSGIIASRINEIDKSFIKIKEDCKRIDEDFDCYGHVIKKYLNTFTYNFSNNQFPMVFRKEGVHYKAFCNYHLHEKAFKNNYFFDIKNVSHNSPTEIEIGVISIIAYTLFAGLGKVIKMAKDNAQRRLAVAQEKDLLNERKIKEKHRSFIRIVKDVFENNPLSEKMINEDMINEIDSIEDPIYRKMLIKMLDHLIDSYEKLLTRYSFQLSEVR